MDKNKNKKFELKVASKPENLQTIREFVRDIALNSGFDADSTAQIELAVDEACTNVIRHAHKYNMDKFLELFVQIKTDKIEIVISDMGKGFDVARVAKPDLKKYMHEAKKGGFGIHLMRNLMDEVHFDFKPGKRNQVTLIKYSKKSA